MPQLAWSPRLSSFGLLLVLIHGSPLALMMPQQSRGDGGFSEGVLHHEKQEQAEKWLQMVQQNGLGCFCCNSKNKANK